MWRAGGRILPVCCLRSGTSAHRWWQPPYAPAPRALTPHRSAPCGIAVGRRGGLLVPRRGQAKYALPASGRLRLGAVLRDADQEPRELAQQHIAQRLRHVHLADITVVNSPCQLGY